ncbi:MAG: TetR family transcriptional regulator [Trueperaceae bacterium]
MPRTGLSQADLKLAVLEAVEANVRRYGLERTRLVDVAKTLGISHSALYKLFPDKQTLLDEVSDRWLLYIEAELEKVVGRKSKAATKLRDWFVTLHQLKLKKVQVDPELYAAFDMASSSMRPFIQRHLQVNKEQLERIITQGMKTGEFKKAKIEALSQMLSTATLAFHHPKLVLDNLGKDRLVELNALLDVLLIGISNRPNQ